MPKKNNIKRQDYVRLNFTGKAVVIMELEDYGPIEYRINDVDVVLNLMKLVIAEMGNTTPVSSYDGRTAKTFKKLLDF